MHAVNELRRARARNKPKVRLCPYSGNVCKCSGECSLDQIRWSVVRVK